MFTISTKDFDKYFVGFDDQMARMNSMHNELTKNIPNYPPYNIRKVDDTNYVIEMAVAGFGKTDINIELDGDKLVVSGNSNNDAEDNFIFKGIANRAFTRTFLLNDKVEVVGADLFNGMLKIALERLVKSTTTRNIEIGEPRKKSREFLTE